MYILLQEIDYSLFQGFCFYKEVQTKNWQLRKSFIIQKMNFFSKLSGFFSNKIYHIHSSQKPTFKRLNTGIETNSLVLSKPYTGWALFTVSPFQNEMRDKVTRLFSTLFFLPFIHACLSKNVTLGKKNII
jgi:hypothetical protein